MAATRPAGEPGWPLSVDGEVQTYVAVAIAPLGGGPLPDLAYLDKERGQLVVYADAPGSATWKRAASVATAGASVLTQMKVSPGANLTRS